MVPPVAESRRSCPAEPRKGRPARGAPSQFVVLPVEVIPVLRASARKTLLAPLKLFELMPTVCESTSSTPDRLPQPVVGVRVSEFELTSMFRIRLNSRPLRRARNRFPRKLYPLR